MQDRPGLGPRWPLLVVHVWTDREADEQVVDPTVVSPAAIWVIRGASCLVQAAV